MPDRRRILVLTPFPPNADGRHGGARAIGQLLGHLSEEHELAIVSLRAPDDQGVDDRLRSRARIVEVETTTRSTLVERARHRARLRVGLLRGRPLRVTELSEPGFADAVTAACREWRPEVVQIEFDAMGQYVGALADCGAPKVLVVHEPGPEAAREGREPGGALVRRLDVAAWKRFERGLLAGVQAAVVFTDHDRRSIEPFTGRTPLFTIAPGVELPSLPEEQDEQPNLLVFVGNYIHAPNVDAAQRLAREILPRIRERRPEVMLELVGPQPPASLRALAGDAVTVTGEVPDLAPHLSRAAVVVVPLRHGGGMRIKVLDALAAGKATVASPLAVEGLGAADVRVADSDNEFAESILELLGDPDARHALGRRARAWAEANLRWERAASAYARLYDQVLAGREGPGR